MKTIRINAKSMKKTTTSLVQLLMLCILILPGAVSAADSTASERWERGGVIEELRRKSFVVNGQTYRVSRSATIETAGSDIPRTQGQKKRKNKTRLRDLRVGDQILFEGKLHNGENRVDKIIYVPPSPIRR